MKLFGRIAATTTLALVTAFVFAGEDAAKAEPASPPAPAAPAVPAETPKPADPAATSEEAKAPPVAPAGMPQFPLKSEFFGMVVDSQTSLEDQQEAQQIEANAMNDIFKALTTTSDEHLFASVNQKAKFRELMLRAEQYRGHVVQIRGLLESSETMKVGDNPAGVQRVYMGQISNLMGEIVTFISLTPPEAGEKLPVRLTGVFLKRYAYLNRREGEKLTWTPLVFVKRVEPYSEEDERGKAGKTGLLSYVLSGAAFFVFVAWFAFRLSRFNANRKMKDNPFTRKKKQLAERQADKPS